MGFNKKMKEVIRKVAKIFSVKNKNINDVGYQYA